MFRFYKLYLLLILSLLFNLIPLHNASAVYEGEPLFYMIVGGGLGTIGAAAYQLSNPNNPKTPALIVADAIQVSLTLLAIIFLALVVYAGFRWLTSGGSDTIIGAARSLLIHAVIGLLIVLAAYSITYFVIENAIKASQEEGEQII
jgi:hypothetical protein